MFKGICLVFCVTRVLASSAQSLKEKEYYAWQGSSLCAFWAKKKKGRKKGQKKEQENNIEEGEEWWKKRRKGGENK